MISGKRKPKDKLTRDQVKKKSISHITVTTTSISKPLNRLTRVSLMKQAQEAGIKYFRILTKDELFEVTRIVTLPATRDAIIEKAKIRWKAGWGKRGSHEEK